MSKRAVPGKRRIAFRSVFASRLGVKFAVNGAAALVVAFAVYILLNEGLFWWILNSSAYDGLMETTGEYAAADFQDYVTDNGLTVSEAIRDITWRRSFREAELFLVDANDARSLERFSAAGQQGLPVRCSNGTVYAFAFVNFAHFERIAEVTSVVCAALSFFIVLLPYIFRAIRRITHLNDEMEVLTGGDLSYEIESPGTDELAELGRSIEAMRRSVLEQMAGENEAVLANSRLITSLSHDLRTPLTKLTGYLELLRYDKVTAPEDVKHYLDCALENANQMKTLSDEMFSHFQVRPASEEPGLETVSGRELLSQLIGEVCFSLQALGFSAEPPELGRDFSLRVRVSDMRRIFDNIFSNIKKYADPARPVTFTVETEDAAVKVRQENSVSRETVDDSRGIGLPTVRMLAKRCGGSMEAEVEDGSFCIELRFPCLPDGE